MSKLLLNKLIDTLNALDDRDYLMAKIAMEAAPTLAGMKPSSLVTFSRNARNLYGLWERYKSDDSLGLGLSYYEVRRTEKYIVVLFYQPQLLSSVLTKADNCDFLRKLGYRDELSVKQVLQKIREKFRHSFPHEVGLLLGIPRQDVLGFIRNGGEGHLFCGYWKVYHNPSKAYRLFRGYDRARESVIESICLRQVPLPVVA